MREHKQAQGTIEVKTYTPTPYDERPDAPSVVEINVTERFSGDVTGDGAVRFVQVLRKDGSASFCGIERVDGRWSTGGLLAAGHWYGRGRCGQRHVVRHPRLGQR
jgi:hypothetical protein